MVSTDSMRSLTRAISVLKSFTTEEPELSPSDIARKIEVPKPTIYRVLACLTKARLLEKSSNNNKYEIGSSLYILGSLYLSNNNLLKACDPVIKALNDLTGEVTNVAILDGKGNITFVMREESKHGLRIGFHVGFTSPAYANALGKALLSELTDDEIDSLYPGEELKPITQKTIATKTGLKQELEQIRKAGFASISEQALEGVEAVAAVVRDARGESVAATAIGVPIARMNEQKRQILGTLIRLGASLISFRLGYQGADNPIRSLEEIRDWWEQNRIVEPYE